MKHRFAFGGDAAASHCFDEYEENASDYEMGEIYDESLSINHWTDRRGNMVALGEIQLNEDEIVSDQALEEWDPSDEEFEGYTGNAGMTLDRWYHRAAVVIWPREGHLDVLCGAGTEAAIGGLDAMVAQLKQTPKARREEQRKTCREFASAIIASWQPEPRGYYSAGTSDETAGDSGGRAPPTTPTNSPPTRPSIKP